MSSYTSASIFFDYFQPSECSKRIWLRLHHPELCDPDTSFQDMLRQRGRHLEARHLGTLIDPEQPLYKPGDYLNGLNKTLALINNQAPIIYQGVLLDQSNNYLAIPDLLIFDPIKQTYKLRDIKMAVDLENHDEIKFQMGFYVSVAKSILGYSPEVEIVKGNNEVVSYSPALDYEVEALIREIRRIEELLDEPTEDVGKSKCGPCGFKGYCWDKALADKDISILPYVDKKVAAKLRVAGVNTCDQLLSCSEALLTGNKISLGTAAKIKRQAEALLKKQVIKVGIPNLPSSYLPKTRPVIMFDIENDVFDIDLGVKVYLWGCLLAQNGQDPKVDLIVADPGVTGDKKGWFDFLDYAEKQFYEFGDIPFVHYSHHEKTWVNKYIERYGDPNGIAARVLRNLWDLHPQIKNNFFLPTYSYGLKDVEGLANFSRSQDDYGGLWSIVMYDRYLNASDPVQAQALLDEILVYNTEDIQASLAVYEWIEGHC